jgi:hypothetical protein
VLDGVPCRILLLYGCFEPRFDSDSHKRNGDGHCGLSIGGGTGQPDPARSMSLSDC